MISNVIYLH